VTEHLDPIVQRLREEISEVDRAILDVVNARLELVARIRSHKAEIGLPFVDPNRERELVEALERLNAGPLSAEGVRELYAYLLDLTKREIDGTRG
jgi:chorismate mutase/prephenate dehydratase